jgi:molybdenum cofactor biosynthesis enzyme MoaA/GNAT superfamily N-acetyltransferase
MNWEFEETTSPDLIFPIYRRVFDDDLSLTEFNNRTKDYKIYLYLFLRKTDKEKIGFAVLKGKNSEVELWLAGVLPEQRRQGAGGYIIEQCERLMAECGYDRIYVNTYNRWNIMISVLTRRGYQILKTEYSDLRRDLKITLRAVLRQRKELRYALTEKCNFQCLFCHNEGLGHDESSRQTVPLDQVVSVLEKAVSLGCTDITFTGGEPLLKKKRLLSLLKSLSGFSLVPDVTLVTNGSLLTDDIIDAFVRYPGNRKIHLSLHATDADSFMKITRAKNQAMFEQILCNIRKAAASGLTVKVNHVVLQDLNHSKIQESVSLARSLGASAIKFLELLVLPDAPQDYRMYYETSAICHQIEPVAIGPERPDPRRLIYRHREDSNFIIEVQQLTCAMGCIHCRENRDRTISSDLKYHPCFVRSKVFFSIDEPDIVESIFQKGDRIVDGFAARFGESSPTLIQKEQFVAAKSEFFFLIDDMTEFKKFIKTHQFRLVDKTGFHEVYFRPVKRTSEWDDFQRVLKVGWDYHNRSKVDLIYTDHQYIHHPEHGMETITRFLDQKGPMRFPSYEKTAHFLDRLGFESFLQLDWELEGWESKYFKIMLGVSNQIHTAKVSRVEGAKHFSRLLPDYPGVVKPLERPLAQYFYQQSAALSQ